MKSVLPIRLVPALAVCLAVVLVGCRSKTGPGDPDGGTPTTAASAAPERFLEQPKVIESAGDSIDTALVIKFKKWLKKDNNHLVLLPDDSTDPNALNLRTYGSPKDYAQGTDDAYLMDDANLDWTIPGPTFRIRHRQAYNLKLINRLTPPVVGDDDHKCNPDNQDGDVAPNCFHGDNTTNFHYHGFRISPEPPQDWIFLQLRPEGSDGSTHPDVRVGEYQFNVEPLQEIQPVGTHWYHAHKHGATALQVMNGMGGAFIVTGYFDEYLREQIPGLQEKLLVVQQINEKISFPSREPDNDLRFWVNGKINPIIEAKKGEIQHWRFVGATQQASARIVLTFNDFEACQIAQDGVPFATENYIRQPLDLSRPNSNIGREAFAVQPTLPSKAEDDATCKNPAMQLASGNRVDVLIKAPDKAGDYPVTLERVAVLSERLATILASLGADDNSLVTLRVRDETQEPPMDFPDRLPDLPPYLHDIDHVESSTTVAFTMDTPAASDPPPQFFIDGEQYNPARIDHKVFIDRNVEWLMTNSVDQEGAEPVAHPFHIHVNPFQITHFNGRELPKPWIWWDTFALPVRRTEGGETVNGGNVNIRQRFLEFTGRYVLHCHILGHEDRGMMQNVEAKMP